MKNTTSYTFTITIEEAGQRLDHWLTENKNFNYTRTAIQNLIEKSLITVNNGATKSSYKLKVNDLVFVQLPEITKSELLPFELSLDILFEDDHLIVINKPAGLVVHPAAGHEQDTLVNALLFHTKNLSMKFEERPGIVHRIDKDTSGLIVIAKNDFAHEHLSLQFKNRTTHRIYYAICAGREPALTGIIRSYLARHPTERKRYASFRENQKILRTENLGLTHGKWAVTHYQKILTKKDVHLLKVKLETGRTHQIRVHLSEQGNPLVGDIAYGYSIKNYREQQLSRFYLHAAELGFVHPITNESHLYKCDWPAADKKRISVWGLSHEV